MFTKVRVCPPPLAEGLGVGDYPNYEGSPTPYPLPSDSLPPQRPLSSWERVGVRVREGEFVSPLATRTNGENRE